MAVAYCGQMDAVKGMKVEQDSLVPLSSYTLGLLLLAY